MDMDGAGPVWLRSKAGMIARLPTGAVRTSDRPRPDSATGSVGCIDPTGRLYRSLVSLVADETTRSRFRLPQLASRLWRRGADRFELDSASHEAFVPFCHAEAGINVLTNPEIDVWGRIPEFKYCAARVERIG